MDNYNELYPDEEGDAVGVSTILAKETKKSKKEVKKVETVNIKKQDLQDILDKLDGIKQMITNGSNIHRVFVALEEVIENYKKRLLK